MFDLSQSQERAAQRLARPSTRRRRADAGTSRLHPRLIEELSAAVRDAARPAIMDVWRRLVGVAARRGLRRPSRASIYNTLPKLAGRSYRTAALPAHVRNALYNLAPDGTVSGPQLVFYCFNYGSLAAVSYAAGLPWLDLYQARRLRGWRPRSLGLLHAAMRARGMR